MSRIYLDHNATTPVDPRVLERFVATEQAFPANPSSPHAAGRRARAILEEARQSIADRLAVEQEAVVFVSGGTEANNMAVLGLGPPTGAVVASAAEHASVLEAAKRRGLVELTVQPDGRPHFDESRARSAVRPPALVCAVYGQSEVGSLSDLVAARTLADTFGAALHVDATQALGRVDLGPVLARADTVTLSLHKAGGLRGVGLLIVRRGAPELRALSAGGGQEDGRRSGTVSPALAVAAAATVAFAITEREDRSAAMSAARKAFWSEFGSIPEVARITPEHDVLPNTLMLAFDGVSDGRTLLPAIDLAGVDASQGSACSAGAPQPPAVLRAMGMADARARRCVRFSFAATPMLDAAQQAARRVAEVIARLQRR